MNDGPADVVGDLVHAGRYSRLPPGDGTFPLAEFARTLDAAGYRGPLSAEVLSDSIRLLPPVDGARILRAHIELNLL